MGGEEWHFRSSSSSEDQANGFVQTAILLQCFVEPYFVFMFYLTFHVRSFNAPCSVGYSRKTYFVLKKVSTMIFLKVFRKNSASRL